MVTALLIEGRECGRCDGSHNGEDMLFIWLTAFSLWHLVLWYHNHARAAGALEE